MNKKVLGLTAVLVLLAAAPLQAEVRFNGFASIVAGTTFDEDESLYGYDDTLSFKPESLFALQVSSDLGDKLTATAQIISRGENDFETDFEWAYLSYQLNDNTQMSIGRMRIPFYRYSDYLDVGYAYTWVRPPQSVYNLVFSTFDGVSVINNHTLGSWDSSLQFIYGSYTGGINLLSDDDPSELNDMAGLNWTLSYDWFTARAVYIQAETSTSFANDPDPNQTLNTGIGLVGNIFPDAANGLLVDEDDGSFLGFGVSIDHSNFLIDAEFTTVEVEDSLVATQKQFYVSVAYQFDEWSPYVVFQSREDTNDDDYSSNLPELLEVPGIGPVPVRATFLQILASQESERDVVTLGARYNFHPSAALKFDYTSRDSGGSTRAAYSVGINLVF